ncbi:MAG: hypothetical protein ACPGJV_06570 [Bacteriovoracaceae bacterium]
MIHDLGNVRILWHRLEQNGFRSVLNQLDEFIKSRPQLNLTSDDILVCPEKGIGRFITGFVSDPTSLMNLKDLKGSKFSVKESMIFDENKMFDSLERLKDNEIYRIFPKIEEKEALRLFLERLEIC